MAAADPILGVAIAYNNDPHPNKVRCRRADVCFRLDERQRAGARRRSRGDCLDFGRTSGMNVDRPGQLRPSGVARVLGARASLLPPTIQLSPSPTLAML